MNWIIQLRGLEEGYRYFTTRNRSGVTTDHMRAKVFADKTEAKAQMAKCTLWEDRKLLETP